MTDPTATTRPARSGAASARPRIVIVGGGFGGLFAAKHLRRAAADVVLVDRGTSNLFQPLLYQCATGLLSEGQITTPLRKLVARQRNIRVLLGEATALDATARTVTVARPEGTSFELSYDYLIVAVGMRQSYFGHEQFARFAPGMKTLDDALAIRRRVYGAFEIAETLPTPEERAEWLTFAVAGAGPTGVELAGQIRELATMTIAREFRTINPREARVLLFDGAAKPLATFGPELARKAERQLERLGVELKMGVFVNDVDATGLMTKSSDGTTTRYAARTVLWTAGVEVVPFVHVVAAAVAGQQDRQGRITVNPDLTVPGQPHVFVIGDVAALDDLPGVAEVALQGGMHAAAQIRRQLAGKPRKVEIFKYRDLGSAAYVSRFHAVVEFGPFKLSGLFGWLLWGVIHLAFLSGARNRAGAAISWLLALARGARRERAILYGDPSSFPSPYPGPSS